MGVSLWPTRSERPAASDPRLIPSSVFGLGRKKPKAAEKAPTDWREWLVTMFPVHFSKPLAPRHVEFWKWVLAIQTDKPSDPFIGVWPRGGGKSASAEGAVAAVGVRGRRKYVLYVRETQKQADDSVQNIATLLEMGTIERFYPEHSTPLVSKYGEQRGWRRNRLRTAGGFTVDALGLDTAARGSKVDADRPDLIILDDIDAKHDSPAVTKKKEEIITHTILPAMNTKTGTVLGIQNLIIRDGIFSQLSDGRADFLADRQVSGPFPAISGLEYEWRFNTKSGVRKPVITKGTPTWEGQSLEDCQHLLGTIGLSAFLKECQQKVKGKVEGVVLRFDEVTHVVDMTDEQCRTLAAKGRVFGGIDFGAWRFGFVLFAVDEYGVVFRIDERFSQDEGLTQRAKSIHECCEFYGIEKLIIWGDAANPQDIIEINQAFRRGWVDEWEDDEGQHAVKVTSKLRVVKVGNENKLRKASVEKMNDAFDRNVLRIRRGVGLVDLNGERVEWYYGMNAESEGTVMTGSRFVWEMENWSYAVPVAGKAQNQDPVDDTADGADMIAAGRYGLMSWWGKAKMPEKYPVIPDDTSRPFDMKQRRFRDHPHAADELFGEGAMAGRRAPRVNAPRPRIGR